jgi:hypothetical protein
VLARADEVIEITLADFRYWQIVLKKSFSPDAENFPGPPMRFASGDVRDLIISRKNGRRPLIGAMGLCSDRDV